MVGPAQARLGDRSLFPTLKPFAYLAHASISPLSQPVQEVISEMSRDYAENGVAAFSNSLKHFDELRSRLARLIGAQRDEIAFVQNTTLGVLDIAYGIDWKPGDEIVVFEDEFPANVTPWKQAAKVFGCRVVECPLQPFFESSAQGLRALEEVLSTKTRLVAVSAVQFKSGLRMPISSIVERARAFDAEVFVDAIQAIGGTPVDVSEGFDYLACGSHKWLMGTEGAAFLYVSEAAAARLQPRLVGWLSHVAGESFLMSHEPKLRDVGPLKDGAQVFEVGTLNAMGFAALNTSSALIEQLQPAVIFEHVQAYIDELESGLVGLGFRSFRSREHEMRSCVLCMMPPEGVTALTVATSVATDGLRCNTPDAVLRFSPHWPNHVSEVPKVLETVERALAGHATRP